LSGQASAKPTGDTGFPGLGSLHSGGKKSNPPPPDDSPSIDYLSVPPDASEGDEVTFAAEASGSGPLTYTWDFGDGNQVSDTDLTTTTHVYQTNTPPDMPYTVTLTVSNATGQDSQTGQILVQNAAPDVYAGPSQTVYQGDTVQFNGTASDAGGPGDIAAIEWNFDYNGTFMTDDSGSLTPTHVYNGLGTHLAALRVTDASGDSSLDVTTIDVQPAGSLLVHAGAPQTGSPATPVMFSGSYTGGGEISPGNIAWDFNYNGSTFHPMITGTLTPSYTFAGPGYFRVALQVTGTACGPVIDETTASIHYQGPTAQAGPDQAVTVADMVQFHGSYTDPDGTVSASGIAWDFHWDGDFTPEATGTLTPTYQFTANGDYTVALQVTDNHGAVDLSFLSVEVDHTTPYAYAGPDRTVAIGDVVAFAAYYQIAGDAVPAAVEWDFDYDGSTFHPDPSATGDLHPTRVYNSLGNHTVALRVTDNSGASQIATTQVTVTDPGPVVNAGADLTITQGDTAQFGASVSCVDPVRIEWDFNYQGDFNVDHSADGQTAPQHRYLAPGVFVAAIRVTNTVTNDARIRYLQVTVNDVPPTAVVSNSGPASAGSAVTFNVTNMSSLDPNAEFSVYVDWTGSGNFEAVPRATGGGNSLNFTHIWDLPGSYPVTVRLQDGAGRYTNYTTTATVTPATPTVTFIMPVPRLGGEPLGPGVPFRFYVQDPSQADWLAGFTYYVSVDGSAFVPSSSDTFTGPGVGTHSIRGYVTNKDGISSNIYQIPSRNIYSSHTTIANTNEGLFRIDGAGDPIILGPGQAVDFPTIVDGLSITLLTSGADYHVLTNGSLESVDFDSGVQGVSLEVLTDVVGEYSLPPVVGDGHIGMIHLPPGNPSNPNHLYVDARGYIGGIEGPGGSGLHGIVADLITGDSLTGPITGLDHITTLSFDSRISADVTVNCGIDTMQAQGIAGNVISDLLRSSTDASGPGSNVTIGHGGDSGLLDIGKVRQISTSGALDRVHAQFLAGSIVMGNFSSVNQFYVGTTLGATAIRGDYGAINQLIVGPGGADNLPALDYFPLGDYIIQDPGPGQFVGPPPPAGSERSRFLDYLLKNSGIKPADFQILSSRLYEVHHTLPKELAIVYEAHGININSLENLRAVHIVVHDEISIVHGSWIQTEMDKFNRGWMHNNKAHLNAFLKSVKNDQAFWNRLQAFTAGVEQKYGKYYIAHTANVKAVKQKVELLGDNKKIQRFLAGKADRFKDFSKTFSLTKNLGAALTIFAAFGVIAENAAFAGSIVNPNPRVQAYFDIFYMAYRRQIERAIATGQPATGEQIRYLSERLLDWLKEANCPEQIRMAIWVGFEYYLAGKGG
jgi:PKD repeat protein